MNRTSLRRLVQVGVGTGVALLAVLLLLSLMAEMSMQGAAVAEARRSTSLRLAYELRQTSDDLTRMARSYVATGQPQYRSWFQEILDIRGALRRGRKGTTRSTGASSAIPGCARRPSVPPSASRRSRLRPGSAPTSSACWRRRRRGRTRSPRSSSRPSR